MADRDLSAPERWDGIVEHYATVGESITTPYGLDALAGLDLRRGVRLLDVATGTGALARAAARRGSEVMAIDCSRMLDLPDASFDHACSVFGVMLFPDHRAGLAEIRRVLVPGGSVRLVVWASPDRLAHLRIWEVAVRDVFPSFDDFKRPGGWRAMMTPEGLVGELEQSRFVGVEARPLGHEWSIPSAAWLLAQETDSNPFFERLYKRLGPGSREMVEGRLLARLKEDHGDGPFVLPAKAWLGIGRR